jgi:hypothetical protein
MSWTGVTAGRWKSPLIVACHFCYLRLEYADAATPLQPRFHPCCFGASTSPPFAAGRRAAPARGKPGQPRADRRGGQAVWLRGPAAAAPPAAGWPPGPRAPGRAGRDGRPWPRTRGRRSGRRRPAGDAALRFDGAELARTWTPCMPSCSAISRAGQAGPRPGTTLTMLELPAASPLLYHVGDSRLYEITRARVARRSASTTCRPPPSHGRPARRSRNGGARCTASTAAGVASLHSRECLRQSGPAERPLFELTAAEPAALAVRPADRRPLALRRRHLPAGHRRPVVLLRSLRLGRPVAAAAGRGWTRPAVLLNALLDAYDAHPPRFFHPDNVSAILLRMPGRGSARRDGPAGRMTDVADLAYKIMLFGKKSCHMTEYARAAPG